jgi:hypothetical protein
MQQFFANHGREWPSFLAGAVVAIITIVAIKRFNKRMDR